jgi:alkylation response protein AidB-like acyl-CoA dehydrogenase
MRALGALGLIGLTVPEAYGGSDAGPVALALAIRELARADASVAITFSVTAMVADLIARFGTEEARRAHVPRLCSGEAVAGAFALSEAEAGSDPSAMRTTVERVADGGYRLSGGKLWTTSGDRAGALVVVARHGPSLGGGRAFSAFVLGDGAAGVSVGRRERKMGQHGSSTVALTLDDVAALGAARLGAEGEGLRVAFSALAGGRIGVAALAVGIAGTALEAAVTYAGHRRQFDRPLGDFQGVSFGLADAATALEAAWLLTLAAAERKQRGLPCVRQASEAKLFATERAVEICDRAIQVHGGYGYTREFSVERHFRDARVTTIYEGTSQIQRLVIARELLREAQKGPVVDI